MSGCPVSEDARDKFIKQQKLQQSQKQSPPQAAAEPDTEVYNVYSQRINPLNNMPANPNQLPVAGQDAALPQSRVQSSIPKGGTDGTWLYPSPQIFYNSLVRKGKKGDDLQAKDAEVIVAIHNNMNEHGWREVQRWETMHTDRVNESKLLKFQGRPHDFSPWARIRSLFFGLHKPFDRHDWIVQRPDGTRVRYILDYYDMEPKLLRKWRVDTSGSAPTTEQKSSSLVLNVRPALDSFGALFDRTRVAFAKWFGVERVRVGGFSAPPDVRLSLQPENRLPSKEPGERLRVANQAEFDRLAKLSTSRIAQLSRQFESDCGEQLRATRAAANDAATQHKAHIALRSCMGRIVCPDLAQDFLSKLKNTRGDDKNDEIAKSFAALDACVERFALAAERQLKNARANSHQTASPPK